MMSAFANYRRGDYDDGDRRRQALPDALSGQPGRGLCAVHHRPVLLQPDPGRDARPGGDPARRWPRWRRSSTRYPDSEYADDAARRSSSPRDQLAGKEMQVGRYYLERREYLAAINRFKIVVTEYPDTRQVEEALYRLVEAYLAHGYRQRGADRRRRARPQLPGQPVVQGRLHAAPDEGRHAARTTAARISKACQQPERPEAGPEPCSSRSRSATSS